MSKIVSTSRGVHLAVLLVLALMLAFAWASFAYANTPFDAQYGQPTASGESVIQASGLSAGGGSSGPSPSGASLAVLPSTGGSLLPLVALGVLALSATGLLAVRRFDP